VTGVDHAKIRLDTLPSPHPPERLRPPQLSRQLQNTAPPHTPPSQLTESHHTRSRALTRPSSHGAARGAVFWKPPPPPRVPPLPASLPRALSSSLRPYPQRRRRLCSSTAAGSAASSPHPPPPRRPPLRIPGWRLGRPGGRSPPCSSTWTACSAIARSPRARPPSTSSPRWALASPSMTSSPSWAQVIVSSGVPIVNRQLYH
jgi:hypothetical protein